MDPLSLVALGAAVGGGTGKFVEKAWDSGEKWIQTFFKDHKDNAQQKALENSKDFLNELAIRVKQIEDERKTSKESIEEAQDHPDFSAFLQKALITSSQTDNKDKHKLLARLVSERLVVEPESIFSLASKMACDAIAFTSSNQIKLLALIANLYGIRPSFPQTAPQEQYQFFMNSWLEKTLYPYLNFDIGNQDLNHLESLSCLRRHSFMGRDLNEIYSLGSLKFNFDLLSNETLKSKIISLWHTNALQSVDLTTTGQIIGVMTSDLITRTKTNFIDWE